MSTLVQALSLNTIIDPIHPQLQALDVFLNAIVEEFEPEVQELARYALSHQGKRLRPIFAFYSYSGPLHADIIKVAAILEIIHLATLLHDDVIDHGLVRHKARTVNALYGADVAILLGDAFFAKALCIASSFPTTYICKIVSESTRRLCAGEISQTLSQKNNRFCLTHYYRIIDLKTADLFSTACHAGAYIGGLETQKIQALSTFGRHLGRAYQIYDDLNDIFGKESYLGKTLGTDFHTQKYTLPILLWLESKPASTKADLITGLLNQSIPQSRIIEDLKATNIKEKIKAQFLQEIHKAQTIIKGLPNEENLLSLTEFIAGLI